MTSEEYSPITWLMSDKHSLEVMRCAISGWFFTKKQTLFSFPKGNLKHLSKGTGLIAVLSGSNRELVWKIVYGGKGTSAVSQLFVWNVLLDKLFM